MPLAGTRARVATQSGDERMPYYAYVNGKATIGLGTVEELNEYIKKSYGHYTRADVEVYDMTWTREGQQLMDSYCLVKGERKAKKKDDYVYRG